MAIGTGSSFTVARLDNTTGLPERTQPAYVQQMASGETLPVLKKELVKLFMGRRLLLTTVFVAEATDEFFMGLDVLHVHDTTVNLKQMASNIGDSWFGCLRRTA
jgi:hypothetical protein